VVIDPRTIQPDEEDAFLTGLQSIIRKEDYRK